MTQAFLIVTLQTLKNRIVSRIKRLKNPRYLISTLVALAYFWFMFFRRIGHGGRGIPLAKISTLPVNELMVDAASIVFFVLMVGAWALPEQSGGLEFSEAEIQFLFGAPITRTQILLYKFLRGLPGIVLSVTIMSIFGLRQAKGIGLLFVFGTLSAYFILVALGRARLKLLHVGALARIAIVGAIFFGISWMATVRLSNVHFSKSLKELARQRPGAAMTQFDALFHTVTIDTVLFVPRIFATALFPADPLHLLIACASLLVLATVSFLIAARLNVAFQEASIAYSNRRAARRERRLRENSGTDVMYRHGRPLFKLGDTGRPEVAFLWKNLLSLIRVSLGRTLALIVPLLLFVVVISQLRILKAEDRYTICGSMSLGLVCIFALLGPQMFKNDLRLDLSRFEVLKTYPLSGDTIVAGEIAAPLILLSILEISLIIAGTTFLRFGNPTKFADLATPEYALIVIILVVPVTTLQLLIQNAAVIYFPAWANPSKEDLKGITATGQRLLVLAGYLLVLAVLLLPPAAVFVPAFLLAQHYFPGTPMATALTTIAPVAVLVGEILLALKMLGAQFERIDVSADL